MSTLAVIPARLGASRLPRKPLRLLAGLPLIVRVWQRVAALGVAERCVVATDSDEVASAVRAAGGECISTRGDHPSGTDRVAEVASKPEFRRYEVIVNVQGDEPFIAEDAIRGAAAMVAGGKFVLGTAAAVARPDILDRPNVVKVVCADDGRALYFSRAPIPFLRDPSNSALLAGAVRHHVGVYAYTPAALAQWVALPQHPLECIEQLEQLRPLAAGMSMGVSIVTQVPPAGIDTEDDLARANARWTDLIAGRT